jgi:hypothetical protein
VCGCRGGLSSPRPTSRKKSLRPDRCGAHKIALNVFSGRNVVAPRRQTDGEKDADERRCRKERKVRVQGNRAQACSRNLVGTVTLWDYANGEGATSDDVAEIYGEMVNAALKE